MTVLTDVKTRWDRVAQRLRAELGEDLYTSWFARMELEEFEHGRLIVSVPTRFLKSWIETHYISKLQKIGEAELGPLDSVHVRVRMRCGVAARLPGDEAATPVQPAAAPAPRRT